MDGPIVAPRPEVQLEQQLNIDLLPEDVVDVFSVRLPPGLALCRGRPRGVEELGVAELRLVALAGLARVRRVRRVRSRCSGRRAARASGRSEPDGATAARAGCGCGREGMRARARSARRAKA